MLAASPFRGVVIRQRQSSETTETQVPVKSTGAPARPGIGGGGGADWPNCANAVIGVNPASSQTKRSDFTSISLLFFVRLLYMASTNWFAFTKLSTVTYSVS